MPMLKQPAARTCERPAPRIITYRQWQRSIGPAVALRMVGPALGITAGEVARAIRRGRLRLHTFRAEDGRVFRMVPLEDLRCFHRSPLTDLAAAEGYRRALRQALV